MSFQVICSDPPWSFEDKLKKMKAPTRRSAESQYSTMSLAEICAIDVKSITDCNGAFLALWVPSSLLRDGLEVMDAWGFRLKQTFVWVKTKKAPIVGADPNDVLSFGMGRLFRQAHEIALIGTSGKSVYPLLHSKSERSVTLDPNDGHSIKPESLQDRLDLMFPTAQKLEMFARRLRPGWTCLGNEIDGKDINDAVHDLSNVVVSTSEVTNE